nr:PREDICTED: uncharacterized protein LOC103996679 isoform X1 [Musa acuminata subsp. malaccensis]
MKLAKKFRPQVEPRSFGSGLIVGCFLVSTTYVMMSKTMISMEHLSILNCLPSSSSIDVTPMSSMVEKNKRIQLSEYESATRESKPTRSDAIEMHGNASSAESASEVPFEEDNVSSTKNGSDGMEEEEGISRLCESSSGNCKPENDREVLETLTAGDSSESGSLVLVAYLSLPL